MHSYNKRVYFTYYLRHTAGISMIKDLDPQTFLTACYDGLIRVWDMRKLNSMTQLKVGDQCWDFVLKDKGKEYVFAAACVYDAAYLMRVTKEWKEVEKVKFEEHESIVYGVDFIDNEEIVTCSFYDKCLYTWTVT